MEIIPKGITGSPKRSGISAYYILLIPIFLVLNVSCHSNEKEVLDIETYDLSKAKPGNINNIFSEVKAIELKYDNNGHYPRDIRRFDIRSGISLISDNREMTLYFFDAEGNMISNSASKIGEGPGEYPGFMGHSWNPFNNQVEMVTTHKILTYDIFFNFVGEYPLPVKPFDRKNNTKGLYIHDIFDIAENMHLLHPTGHSPSPNRYILYDSSADSISDEVSYESDIIGAISEQWNSFFPQPDGSILCRPLGLINYIYEVESNDGNINLKPIIELHQSKDGITLDDVKAHQSTKLDLANDIDYADYLLNTPDRTIPTRVLPTAKRIIVNLKKGKLDPENMSAVVIDRESGKEISVGFFDGKRCTFPKFEYVYGDTAYAVLDKATLVDNPMLLLNDTTQINRVESFDEDNFILLKYIFR